MEGLTIERIITAIGVVSAFVLGWLGRSRTIRRDGAEDGELRANVKHIREGVENLRIELKSQNQRFDMLAERVTRTEEAVKQAHRRIDRLEDEGRC